MTTVAVWHTSSGPPGSELPRGACQALVCGVPVVATPLLPNAAQPAARYLSGSQRSEDGGAWGELLPWWAEQLKDWEGAAAAGQPTTPAVIPVQREWPPARATPPISAGCRRSAA
jgi:hypothetical protein